MADKVTRGDSRLGMMLFQRDVQYTLPKSILETEGPARVALRIFPWPLSNAARERKLRQGWAIGKIPRSLNLRDLTWGLATRHRQPVSGGGFPVDQSRIYQYISE